VKEKKWLNLIWVLLFSVGVAGIVTAGYIFRFSLFSIGIYSMSFYGIFTITHFVLQMVFAPANTNRNRGKPDYNPTVSIVIPAYRETPDLLRACLISIALQSYKKITQVILSNDGRDQYIKDIFQVVSQGKDGWIYLEDDHQGKRPAMYRGFGVATGEIIVCIDSDTVIGPKAIDRLIQPFANSDVGCATGDIAVLNRSKNILTAVTNLRYWLAFNFERAAQSFFGVMTCVSGPIGAYRRSNIEKIKDRWLNQTFLGNPCTFGDDRHLTNLILSLGFKSIFVKQAKAETEAPEHLLRWIQQQLRWSRSFFREFIINLRWFHKHSPWLAFDLVYQAVFPFFLLVNLAIIFYLAFTQTPTFLILWIALLIFFGLIRALYGVISTGNPQFFMFILYGFLYITILLPLKLYAVATLWKTTWGTSPRIETGQRRTR